MSKRKKILLMLAKGGVSQSDIAAALRASKRDVSSCAKVLRENALSFDHVNAMSASEVDELFPSDGRVPNEAYLQPDLAPLIISGYNGTCSEPSVMRSGCRHLFRAPAPVTSRRHP